jgi:hypothetical protein
MGIIYLLLPRTRRRNFVLPSRVMTKLLLKVPQARRSHLRQELRLYHDDLDDILEPIRRPENQKMGNKEVLPPLPAQLVGSQVMIL